MIDSAKPRWLPLKAGFASGLVILGVITTFGIQKLIMANRSSSNHHDGQTASASSNSDSEVARGTPCPSSQAKGRGGFAGFTSLKLVSTQDVNHNTKRLRFEVPDSSSLGNFKPSSVLLTFHKPTDAIFPVIRPYTPIQDFSDPQHVELLVKKYPGGRASTYLHSLKAGDSLSVRGPVYPYTWKSNEVTNLNLIAGGSGITPMYQLIQAILLNPAERTNIKLIFAVNSEADMVLKDELKAMESRLPARFKVAWAISHPAAEDSAFHKGYVNKELLEKELVGSPEDGKVVSKVFMCGPPAMELSLVGKRGWLWNQKGLLEEMGYGTDQIRKF